MCLEWDKSKWDRIENDNQFRFLIAKIVSNQWKSASSPFFKKYRSEPKDDSQLVEDIEDEEYVEGDIEIFTQSLIDGLFISDQNIFKKYYGPEQEMGIVEIAEHYGVNKNFVAGTLQRIRTSFRRRIVWKTEGFNEMEIAEELLPHIGKRRLNIDTRQFVLDVWNHMSDEQINCIHNTECVKKILEKVVKKMKL